MYSYVIILITFWRFSWIIIYFLQTITVLLEAKNAFFRKICRWNNRKNHNIGPRSLTNCNL
jgi:hypothetical protein